MCPQIVKDSPGRPISGSEGKTEILKLRIEPTLKSELTFVCRSYGISLAEGIRKAIVMFINQHHKRYY